MKNRKNYIGLWNESFCLTQEAIDAYLSEQLDEQQIHELENHLSECELCEDAVEGWKIANNEKAIGLLTSIQQEIRAKAGIKEKKKSIPIYTRVAVAASILILMGMFANYQLGYYPFNSKIYSKNLDEWTYAELNAPPRPMPEVSEAEIIVFERTKKASSSKKVTYQQVQKEEEPQKEPNVTMADEEAIATTTKDEESPTIENETLVEEKAISPAGNVVNTVAAVENTIDEEESLAAVEISAYETHKMRRQKRIAYIEKLSDKEGKSSEYRTLSEDLYYNYKNEETQVGESEDGYYIESVEQPPQFYDDSKQSIEDFMAENMLYPQDSEEQKEGRVYVAFTIRKNGKITKAKIIKSLGESYDKEALRLAKLTDGKWIAGKESGKAVRVKYILQIDFFEGFE